jgi:hypothetical protein
MTGKLSQDRSAAANVEVMIAFGSSSESFAAKKKRA